MAVHPVLSLIAIGLLTEIDWKGLEKQDLFSYNYDKGKFVGMPAELLLVRRSASGTKVR